MLVGLTICVYAISSGVPGSIVFPMPNLKNQSFLEPALSVISTTFTFGYFRPQTIHGHEELFAGTWVMFAIFLFTNIGLNIKNLPQKFGYAFPLYPMLAVGISLRFIAILIILLSTFKRRTCSCATCAESPSSLSVVTLCKESLFCLMASIPRATIQGLLAHQIAVMQVWPGFHGVTCATYKNECLSADDGVLISCAQLTIITLVPFGVTLLNTFGQPLLRSIPYCLQQLQLEQTKQAQQQPLAMAVHEMFVDDKHAGAEDPTEHHRAQNAEWYTARRKTWSMKLQTKPSMTGQFHADLTDTLLTDNQQVSCSDIEASRFDNA